MLGRIGTATIDYLAAARGLLHARYLCRRGNDSLRLARRIRPAAAGRSGRKAGGSALGAWPFAAGADRHARAGSATGRRRLSCLPDAGGGVRQFAVWGDTDEGRHILFAVARRPFADRTRSAADR